MGKAIVFASVALAAFLAVAQSGVIIESESPETFSLIDPIIKGILEQMKPKLANLTINDINETISHSDVNATILIKDIKVKNADQFVIQVLKTTMVPLKLNNLTLTWKNIQASASYDVDSRIRFPNVSEPVRIFGKGAAKASVYNIFFTIGANMEMKNNAIQIKPKGLFGFDLRVGKADIALESLMGSPELGEKVGALLSKNIPELVDTLKKPVFDALHDDIVKMVNEVLRGNQNGSKTLDFDEAKDFSFRKINLENELSFLSESMESEENDF